MQAASPSPARRCEAISPRARFILGAILLLGMGLRLYGLTWGFPLSYHHDESRWVLAASELARSMGSGGGILPEQSSFRTLPIYLVLFLAWIIRGLATVAGQSYELAPSVLLAGRALSAGAELGSILLIFALGRLWSVRSGLWAAGLYTVALIAVRESHFFTLEPLATCLALLYVYCVALAAISPTRYRYAVAGCALGLALSVRIFALPLAALILVVLWRDVLDGMVSGGDHKPFVMKRSARMLRGWLGGMAFLWILPILLWGMSGSAIKAYTRNALTSTVAEAKLESHTADFWRAQVDSVYRGGLLALGLIAVAGTGGSLLALHLLTVHRGPRASFETYARLPRIGAFAGGALGSFLILNPGAVVSPFGFWAPSGPDALTWDLFMSSGVLQPPPSWAIHFLGTLPFVYHVMHILPFAWGPPLGVLLLSGLIWSVALLARSRTGRMWPVAITACVLFLLLGAQGVKLTRYVLPVTPFLCILAGGFCAALTSRDRGVDGTAWRFVLGAVWAVSALWCIACIGIYGRDDTRLRATDWVRTHVASQRGLYELDRAWSHDSERELLEITRPRLERYNPALKAHDFLEGPPPTEIVEEKREYLVDSLDDAEYILITDNNRNRLRLLPGKFPVINDYYEDLWAGRLGFELAARFEDGPTLFGMRIDDSWAEPSFRYEDHPSVFVFRRTRESALPARHAGEPALQ